MNLLEYFNYCILTIRGRVRIFNSMEPDKSGPVAPYRVRLEELENNVVTIANGQIVLVVCVVLLAGIAAATDYRVEISGGTFKFEKNTERTESRPLLPPAGEDKTSR